MPFVCLMNIAGTEPAVRMDRHSSRIKSCPPGKVYEEIRERTEKRGIFLGSTHMDQKQR